MKKIIICLLCCIMLAGCGSSSNNGKKDNSAKNKTEESQSDKIAQKSKTYAVGKELKKMAPKPKEFLSNDEYISTEYKEKGDEYYYYKYCIDKCDNDTFYNSYTSALKNMSIFNGEVYENKDDDQYSFNIYSDDSIYLAQVFYYLPDDMDEHGSVAVYIYRTIDSVK